MSLLMSGLCLASSEKQIKLEDIEKDNLKAAARVKLEKQLEKQLEQLQHQYQQQYTAASQTAHQQQYDQQIYAQQGSQLAYPSAYSQYILPQQYTQQYTQQYPQQYYQSQQQLYSGYSQLSGSALGGGYATPSTVNPFQSYYIPQLTTAVQNLQSAQQFAAPTQTQSSYSPYSQASLAGLQQQAYYQVLPKTVQNVQYIPSQTTQQYYYQPQVAQTSATTSASTSSAGAAGLVYATPQQYLASFQPVPAKVGTNYQQYFSTAPQTFTPAAASTFPSTETSSAYTSQTAAAYPVQSVSYPSASTTYQTAQPTFVSLKAPQHLVASPGQQQQYLQAQAEQAQTPTTTISPFKYLNSPQYLAQNYNTIQSSHFLPKSSFSSGIKSTVSPPLKLTQGNTGYYTPGPSSGSSSGTSSSSGLSYQTYRSIAG